MLFEKLRSSLSAAFEKITTTELTEKKLDDLLWDVQIALMQNDIAIDAAEKLLTSVRENLTGERTKRFTNPRPIIVETLHNELLRILQPESTINLLSLINEKKDTENPFVIVFVGVNGTGKTTTIAKIGYYLKQLNYSIVFAAGDTFRAGAVEQLSKHGDKLGIRVIKSGYDSDSASVAYDAINHARARKINVVLIDTAGRMQTNANLMDEMKKIIRVTTPDLTIFVADALAGNDALNQAEEFNNAIGISGSILTKVDADSKGGTAVSVAFATKKPILFVGIGQTYPDLNPFNPEWFIEKIIPS